MDIFAINPSKLVNNKVLDNEQKLQFKQISNNNNKHNNKQSKLQSFQSTYNNKEYFCICGAPLLCTTPIKAYAQQNRCTKNIRVHCDICGKYCNCRSTIYHCSNDNNCKHHPNGYDLCIGCVEQQK